MLAGLLASNAEGFTHSSAKRKPMATFEEVIVAVWKPDNLSTTTSIHFSVGRILFGQESQSHWSGSDYVLQRQEA